MKAVFQYFARKRENGVLAFDHGISSPTTVWKRLDLSIAAACTYTDVLDVYARRYGR